MGANATTPAVVEEFPPPYVFVEVMQTWPTWGSMGSTGHSKFNLFFQEGVGQWQRVSTRRRKTTKAERMQRAAAARLVGRLVGHPCMAADRP